jgi:hypothetical protein
LSPLDPGADLKLRVTLQAATERPELAWSTVGGKMYAVGSSGRLDNPTAFGRVATLTETNVAVGMPGTLTYVDPMGASSPGASNRYYRIELLP